MQPIPKNINLQPERKSIKTIEVDEELLDDIRQLVADQAQTLLSNIVADLHAADIAEILNHLSEEERLFIFLLLIPEVAASVLIELDHDARHQLLEITPSDKISEFVSFLPSDDAADFVAELPPLLAEKVLLALPRKEAGDVEHLLKYDEDTAGGIMDLDFVAVKSLNSVEEATQEVRSAAQNGISVYRVFVVDDERKLSGVISIADLVLNPLTSIVSAIMEKEPKSVETDMDQEEVATLFRKYDLLDLPVVDKNGILVGRITIDDIVDVMEEEHSEDVARMVGSDAEELEKKSPSRIAFMRLPWVLTTLVIEFGAGVVIHFFDKTLSQVILLASFMPIISAISGNTGLQSAAIIVRAMATGHVLPDQWWAPVWRQLQTTLIIGAVCAVLIGFVGSVWQGTWEFGLIVGFSMFISINISGFIGTVVPIISKRLGFDPAITAGPFETAFQDVIGITIFLGLATLLLHWII